MSLKMFSKIIILSIFFVSVLGELKLSREDKMSQEEIEKELNKYIDSIGKDFVNKSINCHPRNIPISDLYYQLQNKFSNYPYQVRSLNDSITNWYVNEERKDPLFISTVDPTGKNQEELSELITDFFVYIFILLFF